MNKVFTEKFERIRSDKKLIELFDKHPTLDQGYIGVSSIDGRGYYKRKIERFWKAYAPYADSDFLQKIKTKGEFLSRTWEMYLACTLMAQGLKLAQKTSDEGPDIRVELDGKTIWVEAVTLKMGETQDGVPGLRYGSVQDIPEEAMLLRIANALSFKFQKYEKYLASGMVKPDEPYVIAISKGEIPHPDPGMPLAVKALFGVGHQAFRMMVNGVHAENPESSWTKRGEITKANGNPVSMLFFESPAHVGISAVLYTQESIMTYPDNLGEDLWLIHNPIAKNPIAINPLRVGNEWVSEGTLMRLYERSKKIV